MYQIRFSKNSPQTWMLPLENIAATLYNKNTYLAGTAVRQIVVYWGKEYGLPRRFAPRNDMEYRIIPRINRHSIYQSQCHCEPVRRLVW